MGTRRRLLYVALALLALVGIGAAVLAAAVYTTPRGVTRSEEGLSIQVSTTIRVPIERVWAAWTTDGGPLPIARVDAMELKIDSTPGGPWCFQARGGGFEAACGRVLAAEEPTRLALTFKACDLADRPHRLLLEFRSVEEGTHVTWTMDRFAGRTQTYGRFARASALLLASMRDELQGGAQAWQVYVYSGFFFDLLGSLVIPLRHESRYCDDDTDYLGDLRVENGRTPSRRSGER